ncbi:MAG: hypothetical protein A2Z14_02060 [Chloroflexi bacterium RBG_16_48_8]|nr:MAG: hypothetical protein A2Z14_02060 [Chloroflexi bacterium RBG_16_48_8]
MCGYISHSTSDASSDVLNCQLEEEDEIFSWHENVLHPGDPDPQGWSIQEEVMFEFISMQDFCQYLFDQCKHAQTAALIFRAILEARSPRLSDLSHKMPANPDVNYKRIQRFLATSESKTAL